MRLLYWLIPALCLLLCLPALASAQSLSASEASLGGGSALASSSLRLKKGRSLYLRFSVPSDWRGRSFTLTLPPTSSSSGLKLRRVYARWEKGVVSRPRPRGVTLSSGPLVSSTPFAFPAYSLIGAGHAYSLRLSSASGRTVRLSSLPSLLVPSSPTPTPDPAPDPKPDPFPVTISAFGDISCPTDDPSFNGGAGTATACAGSRVASLVSSSDKHVLLLGDQQYSSGALAQFEAAFAPAFASLFTRLHPVAGNHEYASGSDADYLSFFSSRGVEVGGASGYYAFDLSDSWRAVALNSNCSFVSCAAGSPQELFLRSELTAARDSGKCSLVYWHHPRVSGGLHGDNLEVSDLFKAVYELSGDLVLSGHDHDYQRFDPLDASAQPSASGVPSFVVGTGGYNLRSVSDHLGQAKRIEGSFGLLRLSLSPGSFAWQWIPESGESSDSGSQSCRP